MPQWMTTILQFSERREVLITAAGVSVASFLASVIGIPVYLRHLPADYFTKRERTKYGLGALPKPSLLQLVRGAFRNTLGVILIFCGLAMLILPGQGIPTFLVGLMLVDLPGKKRLERRILAFGPVFRAVNALRARSGAPPFRLHPQ